MGGTHNHGLDLTPTVNEHAHAMSSRLIAGTIVWQDKRKVYRMFICIRDKVPLLLKLIVDFVCTGRYAAKLGDNQHKVEKIDLSATHVAWRVLGRGN
jgi:hypothetical protein